MGRILKAHQRRDHARHELSLTKIPQDLLPGARRWHPSVAECACLARCPGSQKLRASDRILLLTRIE